MNLLFKITYGLYLASSEYEGKNSACMINTLMQQTNTPERFTVTLNKDNYTTSLIMKSKKLVVSVLSQKTSFDFIKNFGMQSGANVDKFENFKYITTVNNIKVPVEGMIGYFEFDVLDAIDMGTHMLFVLSISDTVAMADEEPLTYGYYQSNIKPKPQVNKSNVEKWVCRICGYVHEGPLPSDFICPLCKHPASDFERVQ